MSNDSSLTLSFIEKRPFSAAQTLAAMEPDDAAIFLEAIPTRYAFKVFLHISAWSASVLLRKMNAAAAAAVLRELDYQNATSILRLIAENERNPLLYLLPERLRRDLTTSLSFPEDTVGAKMTTAIITLKGDQTVADAIDQCRQLRGDAAEIVFVIDDAKKLQGAVTAASLLRHPGNSKLGDIMDTTITPISARARVSAVAEFDAWDEFVQLPVLSRKKLVIGALPRRAASRLDDSETMAAVPPTSIAASMANAFFTSAVGLAQLLAEVDQPPASKRKGTQP